MKTLYIKNTIDNKFFVSYYFYKIVEINDEKTLMMTVTNDSIELDKHEEFHDAVSFVKNKLCSGSKVEEVTRKEFDDFYKSTVEKINKLSSL